MPNDYPMQANEFVKIISDHQGIIYKVCRMYGDSPEEVDDLFQDIVLNLWRSIASFDDGSKVSTWMYRVALNTAITGLRKHKRRRDLEAPMPPDQIASTAPIYNDEAQQLYQAIRQLSKIERALITLYLDDYSYREMADILGISENNVGVRLNRIKRKLKKLVSG